MHGRQGRRLLLEAGVQDRGEDDGRLGNYWKQSELTAIAEGVVIVIQSVEIKGLRGIREGKLTELSPLVVLVGPNGSGKSTVLDALLIAANPSPGEGIGQSVIRREGITSGWPWLLWKMGLDGPLRLAMR